MGWCAEQVSLKNSQFVTDTSDWDSESVNIDWEDIKTLDCAIIERTILDDTVPNGPIERLIQYVAPFDLCSREQDYRTVWQHFEQRFNPLRKAPPIDAAFTGALQGTLSEWNSAADNEDYTDL